MALYLVYRDEKVLIVTVEIVALLHIYIGGIMISVIYLADTTCWSQTETGIGNYCHAAFHME